MQTCRHLRGAFMTPSWSKLHMGVRQASQFALQQNPTIPEKGRILESAKRKVSMSQSASRPEEQGMKESTSRLVEGICKGERAALAKGITLVESSHPKQQQQASLAVARLTQVVKHRANILGKPGVSFRIGLSGPPGAGKSTFT